MRDVDVISWVVVQLPCHNARPWELTLASQPDNVKMGGRWHCWNLEEVEHEASDRDRQNNLPWRSPQHPEELCPMAVLDSLHVSSNQQFSETWVLCKGIWLCEEPCEGWPRWSAPSGKGAPMAAGRGFWLCPVTGEAFLGGFLFGNLRNNEEKKYKF